jgi:hypothetical protein
VCEREREGGAGVVGVGVPDHECGCGEGMRIGGGLRRTRLLLFPLGLDGGADIYTELETMNQAKTGEKARAKRRETNAQSATKTMGVWTHYVSAEWMMRTRAQLSGVFELGNLGSYSGRECITVQGTVFSYITYPTLFHAKQAMRWLRLRRARCTASTPTASAYSRTLCCIMPLLRRSAE